MQYRFYIYQQNNFLPTFNKYDLTEYSLLRQITNNGQWKLKIDRDNEFLSVMRTSFNGEISVSGADFTALIALEGSLYQYCVVIHQLCNKVWTEKWKGYFSYFDYKVDKDRCQLTFTPSPFDIYTPVYDQMDIERNVLAADLDFQIPMDKFDFPNESQTLTALGFGLPVAAAWTEYTGYPAGNQYYLFSQTSDFLEWVPSGGAWFPLYFVTQIYKRDYGLTDSNVPGGEPSPDAEWILDPQLPGPGIYSPGVYKWVRPYHSLGLDPLHNYSFIGSGMNVYEEIIDTVSSIVTLIGMKRLNKVLEFFATFFNLTYASNFFYDTPNCPMGGSSLEWTMIQQISNLGNEQDPATKGLMKLKDLLTWIRDTFNVYWYIDFSTNPLGNWRLEHRMFFDQGLSYTAYVPVIELDMNLYPDNVKHLSRYEWAKPSLFRFEKLDIPYSYFSDWTDAGIEYPQYSIIGNETKTVSVGWGTDASAMYDGRNDLPKQGWVLYHCLDIAGVRVVNSIGAISGISYPNGRFSTANLMRDLWTWGRILPTGNVNGVLTTFGSYEKLRKQVELSIPQCCQDLDYNGIFHTDLGNGLIEAAEYDSKTGELKVNLKYE
jgi:hypothetical protein